MKPYSIGDMRYITVPYTLSLLTYHTAGRLDLYKIWKNQSVSQGLKDLLYDLMVKVEAHIKATAPGALYGEWAKKDDCWNDLKKQDFKFDYIRLLKQELEDPRNPSQRKRMADAEVALVQIQEELSTIRSVPSKVWHQIEEWGRNTGLLSEQQKSVAHILADRVRNKTRISDTKPLCTESA